MKTLCLLVGNIYRLQLPSRLHFHANFLGLSSVSTKEVILNIFVALEVPHFFPMLPVLLFLARSLLGSEHSDFAIFFAVYKSVIKIPVIHKPVCEEPISEILLRSHTE